MSYWKRYCDWFKRNPFGCVLCTFLVGVAVAYGGTKPTPPTPIVTKEGIKITSFASDADGVRISWESEDDRIVEGDTYIVQFAERQIPARGGYGGWQTLTTTTDTSVNVPKYIRDRDVKIRIAVYKEVDE